MGLGTGQSFVAEGVLTRGMAVMVGTAYPQVKVTTGANVKILGFALNDAEDGQEVAIHPVTDGSAKCKGLGGASFDRGDMLMGEGADGRLKKLTPGSGLQYAAAIALEDGLDGQLVDVLPCFFISVGAGA